MAPSSTDATSRGKRGKARVEKCKHDPLRPRCGSAEIRGARLSNSTRRAFGKGGRLISEIGRCAFCDAPFVKRRSDHRFCRPEHRKLGERKPGDGPRADPEDIRRLFDESRDPAEPVRPDDWHPGGPEWNVLDATDSLETRRRWFLELRDRGPA
jgi:hypothetical protein